MHPCAGTGQAGCPVGTRTACFTAPSKEAENYSLNKHSQINVIIQVQLGMGLEFRKKRIAFFFCYFCQFCYSSWHCPNTVRFSPALGFFFILASLSFHEQNGKKGEVKKWKTEFCWFFFTEKPNIPRKIFCFPQKLLGKPCGQLFLKLLDSPWRRKQDLIATPKAVRQ